MVTTTATGPLPADGRARMLFSYTVGLGDGTADIIPGIYPGGLTVPGVPLTPPSHIMNTRSVVMLLLNI